MNFGDDMTLGLKVCLVGLKMSFEGLGINDKKPQERLETLPELFASRPGLFSGV
jgi:hypothetical protein